MTTVDFFCETCHFFYLAEEYEVEYLKKRHKKYHDEFVNGIKATALKTDKVIDEVDGFRIVLVSPRSPLSQRKRAERIALRGKTGTEFDFLAYHAKDVKHYDFPLAFIGVVNNRAVSFLILRKTTGTAKVSWQYYDEESEEPISSIPDVRWGISMVWTLESSRRKGYAKRLIEAASKYVEQPVLEMAWFAPFTDFGHSLAKAISPNEVILTA